MLKAMQQRQIAFLDQGDDAQEDTEDKEQCVICFLSAGCREDPPRRCIPAREAMRGEGIPELAFLESKPAGALTLIRSCEHRLHAQCWQRHYQAAREEVRCPYCNQTVNSFLPLCLDDTTH